jgi:hypothetical protein
LLFGGVWTPSALPADTGKAQTHRQNHTLYNSTSLLTVNAKMVPKQLNFITGNKNKLSETKAILGDAVDLQSQSLDLPEIQGTIEQISIDKCRRAANAVRSPASRLFSTSF